MASGGWDAGAAIAIGGQSTALRCTERLQGGLTLPKHANDLAIGPDRGRVLWPPIAIAAPASQLQPIVIRLNRSIVEAERKGEEPWQAIAASSTSDRARWRCAT